MFDPQSLDLDADDVAGLEEPRRIERLPTPLGVPVRIGSRAQA